MGTIEDSGMGMEELVWERLLPMKDNNSMGKTNQDGDVAYSFFSPPINPLFPLPFIHCVLRSPN